MRQQNAASLAEAATIAQPAVAAAATAEAVAYCLFLLGLLDLSGPRRAFYLLPLDYSVLA
jgi:hypothetical protein